MIVFSISSEDVKQIHVYKPRNKDVGFLLYPKFWCFQKHAFLHILLNLFKTNYCFVIHKVQPLKKILSFEEELH